MSAGARPAHGRRSDQHWLGGLYSNADSDDAALTIPEGFASVELHLPRDFENEVATVGVVFPHADVPTHMVHCYLSRLTPATRAGQ